MTTHTQGPWQSLRIGKHKVITGRGRDLATVIEDQDACLIAAAPDLLIAARDALAVARHPQGCSEEHYHAVLDALDDAINQAEGSG